MKKDCAVERSNIPVDAAKTLGIIMKTNHLPFNEVDLSLIKQIEAIIKKKKSVIQPSPPIPQVNCPKGSLNQGKKVDKIPKADKIKIVFLCKCIIKFFMVIYKNIKKYQKINLLYHFFKTSKKGLKAN